MAKHDFFKDGQGNIDIWILDYGYHNGPGCRRCEEMWCEHCDPQCYDEECPSGELFEEAP